MRSFLILFSCCVFTMMADAQSPGGIATNNTMWLRSDVGVTSAANLVSQWQEVSGAGITGNFTVQPINTPPLAQTSPAFIDAGINFNPYIRFDGFTNSLSGINSFPGTSLVTNSNVTVFQVFNLKGGIVWLKWETDQVGATGRLGFENSSGNIRFDFPRAWPTPDLGQNIGNINVLNEHSLSTAYADAGISTSVNRLNGANNTVLNTISPGDFSSVNDRVVLGNESLLNLPAQIDIAEIIIYKATLTAAERNKIESYLAVKYGFTLDQAAVNANDYTAASGTVIWNRNNNSGYANNITGIGREDASGLLQKQSRSVNAGALITIYNGTYPVAGNFPLLNSTNTNAFSNNGSFLLFGDNNLPTNIDQCFFNGKGLRMQRIWKASQTGTNGIVTISVDNGSIPATAKNLVVSPDPAFPSGATTFYPLSTANGKTYREVTLNHNEYFTFSTDTLQVSLTASPPACTNPNSGNVTTTVTGNASALTYSWSPSGQATPNLTNVAGGTYTLTVTQAGCQSSYPVTLTAPGAPAAPVANNILVCSGNTGTLTVQNPNASYSYNWYNLPTGGALLGTGVSYTATVSATTTFYVEAVTGSCSSPRTAVTVTYAPMPQPAVANATVCPNNTAILTVQSPNASYVYNWYADAANTVLLGTGTSYTTPALTTTTVYYVVSLYSGCTYANSVTVNVTSVAPPLVNNVALCGTNIATFTVQNAATGYIYNWYTTASGGTIINTGTSYTTPPLSANATYYIEAVGNGCVSIRTAASVSLGGAAAPLVNDITICANTVASINVQNASAGYTYNWYSTVTGGSILSTSAPFITPALAATTTYYAEAVNGGCISIRVPVTVYVDMPAVPLPEDVAVCTGDTARLSVQNPVPGLTYNWYADASGGTLVATGPTFTTGPIYSPITYYAGSSDAICQSSLVPVTVSLVALDSVQVWLENITLNSATFSWAPYPGTIGYLVSIDGGPFITPASGNMGTTHTINGLQQSQTISITVIALGPPQGCGDSYPGHAMATTYGEGFYMPTAFTPNGDTYNDIIKPKLPGGAVLEYFTVFNRWGERVFTTNRSHIGWDGKSGGREQPSGTYVWICRYLHLGRIEVEQHGSFMLLH